MAPSNSHVYANSLTQAIFLQKQGREVEVRNWVTRERMEAFILNYIFIFNFRLCERTLDVDFLSVNLYAYSIGSFSFFFSHWDQYQMSPILYYNLMIILFYNLESFKRPFCLQVSSATATFAMTFSASMSVVEYYLLKRFPVPYGR